MSVNYSCYATSVLVGMAIGNVASRGAGEAPVSEDD